MPAYLEESRGELPCNELPRIIWILVCFHLPPKKWRCFCPVLTYPAFVGCVRSSVDRFKKEWLDDQQEEAVKSAPTPPTFIVAGPGSGKTTVLSLRVIKLILVDGFAPQSVVATTFTRKAAAELRSRILAWGYSTVAEARKRAANDGNEELLKWLEGIDVNAITTGTLDSIAEEVLRDSRLPGEIVPTPIEGFPARAVMQSVLFTDGRFRQDALKNFVSQLHGRPYSNFGQLVGDLISLADRIRHDDVDVKKWASRGKGQNAICEAVKAYLVALQDNFQADFGRLETGLLERIVGGTLSNFSDSLQAVLVDEFQDTNYLQEQIYYALCRRSNASLTVVGDDDQSIFRFRGATVEIFADFPTRIATELGNKWRPETFWLSRNYRSTKTVVQFCGAFSECDRDFQSARVRSKPSLKACSQHANLPDANLPVLGVFRDTREVLARDLSSLIWDVFKGAGRTIRTKERKFEIKREAGGDFADAVFLAPSVREFAGERERLPLLLRRELAVRRVSVFNPRGRDLSEIMSIQQLLGLALECIDPKAAVQATIGTMARDSVNGLNAWRAAALKFIASDPRPGGLSSFVRAWQARKAGGNFKEWPREWPLLELIFTLVTWFPQLQTEPEGQVYLEAIARTVSQSGQTSRFGGNVLWGTQFDERCIHGLIRRVFESIASGIVDVDEDIMPHVPRHYFSMMTIHQAKGLEFPFVVVDVGSDSHHNWKQREMRYPSKGNNTHAIEDELSRVCPVGAARLKRPGVQRAWDDTRRLFFVAYSRPEYVLILAGLNSQLDRGHLPPLSAVATGDLSSGDRKMLFVPSKNWEATLGSNAVALL
jgi:DNA helicase II / ATP-dependent DNA helicase PcrA